MANTVERLENAGADFADWTPLDANERRSSHGWGHYGIDDEGRQERGMPPNRAQQSTWPDADLGPLIGRKRGFRTRERVPLSGGLGGMEVVDEEGDAERQANGQRKGRTNGRAFVISATPETPKPSPSFKLSVVSPDGESRVQVKGKERAVDDDVEMRDGDGTESARSMPMDGIPPIIYSDEVDADLSISIADRQLDNDHLHPNSIPNSSTPLTRAHPNLEPRPPDPPDENKMPPKMRKRWMHREVEARNNRREVPSPKDALFSTSAGSDVMSVDAAFRNGGVGLGIRFDIPEAEHSTSPTGCFIDAFSNRARLTDEVPPTRTPLPPSEHDQPTDLPDHAERSQSEHLEASLMPPPPLPATRDTTSVSPQYLSPTTPTPSPPSPHLATPSPPTHGFTSGRRSPRIALGDYSNHGATATHPHNDPYQEGKGATAPALATSPLHDFANLSLLSPAALAQARAQAVSRAPFSILPEPDDAERETGAEAPRDEDVDMESGEDEEHNGDEQALAEPPPPPPADDEGVESQDEVEWSPLRRMDKVPFIEVEVHAASDHEPASSSPEVEAVRKSVMLTVSPLDSVASTPAARLSPQPATAPVVPSVDGEEEKEDGAREGPVVEMVVDEQPPDVPVQSTRHVAGPEITAPPPANFFDTDDPDEWKRQMETSAPPPIPARAPSPEVVFAEPDDDHAQKTPTRAFFEPRERAQSEDSSRSVSPFEEITVTVEAQDEAEVEEPPPQSGTEVDSDPPPPSAESSTAVEPLMTGVEAPRPTVESADAPLPAKDTSVEPSVSNHAVSPVEQTGATAPRQDSQEPISPATQPKVKKISLKEFAERRRQQQMEAAKSAQASPMSVTSALAADDGEGQGHGGGATPKSSIASPAIANLTPMHEPAIAAGPVAEMPKAPDAVPTLKDTDLGELQAFTLAKAAENLAEIAKRNINLKAFQESTKHSTVKPEWLLAKTCANGNDKLLDATVAPALSPSTSPAPVSEPLEKLPTLNGYSQPPRVPSQPPVPPSFVPKDIPIIPITSTPPPPSMLVSTPAPTISTMINTREAKKELVDIPMSSLSATRPATLKPGNPPTSNPYLAPPVRSMYPDRSISPMGPDLAHSFHFRRPSHEDGEIGEGSPPIAVPRSSGANSTFMPKTRPFASGLPPVPSSSHSPPTGPRSLYAPSASPTPSFGGGGGSHYRPAPPPHLVPLSSAATANRPLPPSAPRALRQSMMSGRSVGGGGGGGGNASSSSYLHSGSQYIPRGPLADQRDRDRDWDHHRPYRRRGGGGRAR